MLESIDLTQTVTKEEFAARRDPLERTLFDLVRRAKGAGVPTIVVFEGFEAAGKGRTIFTLTERLDPRTVLVHPVRAKPRSYERERPWMWRYWMRTPARGEMAVFDTSWYVRVLGDRIEG
jgi:polyphosphate kinase 2 (PPK2 family)